MKWIFFFSPSSESRGHQHNKQVNMNYEVIQNEAIAIKIWSNHLEDITLNRLQIRGN